MGPGGICDSASRIVANNVVVFPPDLRIKAAKSNGVGAGCCCRMGCPIWGCMSSSALPLFNSQKHQPEWKIYKNYSNTRIKNLIQRPHSRILTREETFLVQTMHFAIYSMLFLEDRPRIGAVRANSQLTIAVVIQNMQLTCPICKKIGACSTQFTYSGTRRDDCSSIHCNFWCRIWCQWAFEVQFPEIMVCVLIHPFSRNHPDDNSESPVSFDDMLEIINQLKKDFKRDFWTTQSFRLSQKPNYIKWQQAWKNRIKHYTPRVTPKYNDVPVEGVIEKWDPRL